MGRRHMLGVDRRGPVGTTVTTFPAHFLHHFFDVLALTDDRSDTEPARGYAVVWEIRTVFSLPKYEEVEQHPRTTIEDMVTQMAAEYLSQNPCKT